MGGGRVYLVGAGPGDPGLMTVRGLAVLRRAEVVVYDRLVNPALLDEAPRTARRRFAGKRSGGHCLPQEQINALLIEQARRGRLVVRLKGGDPFVFGRGGEEALALAEAGIGFEVVPGVSAAVAVPAYAGIPVTHRGLGSSFAVVTGHEDPDKGAAAVDWAR
ncbi:MAG: uroporphyrinogen-III C-methyltransferase, partial [Candidatus Rokuibacteriota bacterium]